MIRSFQSGPSDRALVECSGGFLAGLVPDDRLAVEALGRPEVLAPNMRLSEAGAPVNDLYFIRKGLVAELASDAEGRTSLVRLAGQGGVAGAAAALAPYHAVGESLALIRTEALRVPAAGFRELAHERPSLACAVNRHAAGMVAEIARHAGCAACHKLDRRLPSLLLHWADREAEAKRLTATHEQLCSLLGAQRTTVTALMRTMRTQGLVGSGRGWIRILDREALERWSCGCHRMMATDAPDQRPSLSAANAS